MCVKTTEILIAILTAAFSMSVLYPGAMALRNSIHANLPPGEMLIAVLRSLGQGLMMFPVAFVALVMILISTGFVLVFVDSHKNRR